MATPLISSEGEGHQPLPGPLARMVDEMLACHAEWHQAAAAAADMYAKWSNASPDAARAWLFSAYVAALDQEQAAAGSYACAVANVELSLERYGGPSALAGSGIG